MNRYHREKAAAKRVSKRAQELAARAAAVQVCAYCGSTPAKRCPAGDGLHVVYRCADCWPKTAG